MKRLLKQFLSRLGLLEFARVLRSFVKGASVGIWTSEFRLRLQGASDGLPLPPQRMMFTIISTRWAETFLVSGAKIVAAIEQALHTSGQSLAQFDSILDFGCGCGRLIRQLPTHTHAKLFGCDYNASLVHWCQSNLPIAEFKINSLDPPLPYPDASFDFIFARSIFTHLPESGQRAWMAELRRVQRPGGILYFTTHGEQFVNELTGQEQERLRAGQLVVQLANEAGRNLCSSFELPAYVEANLLAGFRLLAYIPGTPDAHLQQDAYLAERLQ